MSAFEFCLLLLAFGSKSHNIFTPEIGNFQMSFIQLSSSFIRDQLSPCGAHLSDNILRTFEFFAPLESVVYCKISIVHLISKHFAVICQQASCIVLHNSSVDNVLCTCLRITILIT